MADTMTYTNGLSARENIRILANANELALNCCADENAWAIADAARTLAIQRLALRELAPKHINAICESPRAFVRS